MKRFRQSSELFVPADCLGRTQLICISFSCSWLITDDF